ncbi:NlpC/P60 family protein [Lactococcus lactis subsp. hordniae]|uniref:NlpC/P60 family protein n=3 Tax=Lactococcus lactis TaxID=1358 RepID=A0A5M9PZ54_LACLH|nr:NlpC/P60 family protein [Lactococcus lactis subsp. hordniae]MCT3135188.1 CHAP domain-containing protein [Lactococcus lactis]
MKNIILKIALLLVVILGFSSLTTTTHANFENGSRCMTSTSSSDSGDDSGTADGSWEKEGTKSHANAQKIWNFWKKKGFSGVAIAGVMGNVAHEGNFDIPDRAEGHYGSNEKENGISEGVVPSVGSGYPVGKTGKPEGGGGHYQFTPYSKFADLGSSDWKSTEKQCQFVWDSEVKNAKWLDSYKKIDTVDEAVAQWFTLYERGASLNPEKVTSGKKAYEIFGGSNVGPSISDDTDDSDSTNNSTTNACYNSSSSGGDNVSAGKIVDFAKTIKGYFTYVQVHGEKYIGSVDSPDKNGTTDCSGFVWLVLAHEGSSVPKDMQWYTKTMEDDAKGKHQYLKEVKPEEAKAGDIVIVNTGGGSGDEGHTAILTEDWKAKESDTQNTTKIIQMGGDPSANGVNESTFSYSFLSLVQKTHTITLARAVEKK